MRFVSSGMRDVRIEPSPDMRRKLGLPGAFAHVTAHSDGETAFSALRSLYLAIQSGSALPWGALAGVGRDMSWLLQASWRRYIQRRLLAPRNARFELTLVIEQYPDANNTISLAPDRRDCYGSPLAKIAWRTNPQDAQTFRALQAALVRYWETNGCTAMGTLEPFGEEALLDNLQRDSDIFHPGGTTRMGAGPSAGVLDRDLRTHRVDNLYVVSTSAFPSGGGANPTFMLMAFAFRAVDRVTEHARQVGCAK
jgi:choline dehydrogenase-like flavoprotein